MGNISQTTFWNRFSKMKMFEFRLKWNISAKVYRLDRAKPLSEPLMLSLPTYICAIRPQWWINTWQNWYNNIISTDEQWFVDRVAYLHKLSRMRTGFVSGILFTWSIYNNAVVTAMAWAICHCTCELEYIPVIGYSLWLMRVIRM